jgi:hypothetical protein
MFVFLQAHELAVRGIAANRLRQGYVGQEERKEHKNEAFGGVLAACFLMFSFVLFAFFRGYSFALS